MSTTEKKLKALFDPSSKVKKTIKKDSNLKIEDVSSDDEEVENIQVKVRKDNTQYVKRDHRTHIYECPGMYIGNHVTSETSESVWMMKLNENGDIDENKPYYVKKIGRINDGFIRLFIEVLTNAMDNARKSVEFGIIPRFIRINIKDRKSIQVWNDGKNISTKDHEIEKIPIPEMIFGQLLTSSNYNKDEQRYVAGMNGVGVKVVSIFSKKFEIDIYNKEEGIIYKQEWIDNFKIKKSPKILKRGFPKTYDEGKDGYTSITYIPDYEKFGMNMIDDDNLAMIYKIVYDAALNMSLYKVKVYLNDKIIKINDIKEYSALYFNGELPKENILIQDETSKIILASSNDGFNAISFVNGLPVKEGIHIDIWSKVIFGTLSEKLSNKKSTIDMRDIKKHFFMIMLCVIENPGFDSQTKTRLTSPKIKAEVKVNIITKISKWNFVEKIKASMESKELIALKQNTERKRGKIHVQGLDDANKAGVKSNKCVLFICEGLSAKTYIVEGMKVGIKLDNGEMISGRDYIGVLPLRGKFLNVKNASINVLTNNNEVKTIIQSLGLQHGIDYKNNINFSKLRYHKLIIATDNDYDGLHISGSIICFFETLFPSLLEREGFLSFMRTPIVKINNKRINNSTSFYFYKEAQQYINNNNPKKDDIKYYKGLGTSTDEDINNDFCKRIVNFVKDTSTTEMIDKVFNKDHSDFRKEWIAGYKEVNEYPKIKDYEIERLEVSKFLNQEMILYSIDDCKRSIPNILDGLKDSSRKVLYTIFKRGLTYGSKSLKVAQLAGSVAEITNYHHGEVNLYDTIIKMAQRFVGSNNIPLLHNEGQFGCLDPYTDILMWDGTIKKAKDIIIGDQLVGDDGMYRTVKQITSGEDEMYQVNTSYGYSYKINSYHILTLYYSINFDIIINKDIIYMSYFNGKTIQHLNISFNDNTDIYEIRNQLIKKYSDSKVIDIAVSDYLNLSDNDKKYMFMISNMNPIEWKQQTVDIDPYIYGLSMFDIDLKLLEKSIDCYKYNSIEVRLKLLAGFLDINNNAINIVVNNEDNNQVGINQYIEISYSEKIGEDIINNIEYIAKTLGYNTIYRKVETILCLWIIGKKLHNIPTKRLYIKEIEEEYKGYYDTFEIISLGKGQFNGWSIDGNERFLLGNFIVTHNSRLQLGKDNANGRYIFTKQEYLTRYIYREEDDMFLSNREEDGDILEKETYIPIVPMILVNGVIGAIGSGWSCSIPSYDLKDIINWIKDYLLNPTNKNRPIVNPYYRGFKGDIKIEGNKVITEGILTQLSSGTNSYEYQITEIPLGKKMVSIDRYKEKLEEMEKNGEIKSIVNQSTTHDVNFIITTNKEIQSLQDVDLIDCFYTSNMVLFNTEGELKKYNTIYEILEEYSDARLDLYYTRKNGILKEINRDILILENKIRFIGDVLSRKIDMTGKSEKELYNILIGFKYDKIDNEYDYLLSMQVRSFTQDKIQTLKDKLTTTREKYKLLNETSVQQIWISELDELLMKYNEWLIIEEGRTKNKKIISSKAKGKIKK